MFAAETGLHEARGGKIVGGLLVVANVISANGETGEKGESFIQFAFSFFPLEFQVREPK